MRNRFRNLQGIFHTLGSLLIILSFFLLCPILVSFIFGEIATDFKILLAFLIPSVSALLLGILLHFLFRTTNPSIPQAMLICSLAWIVFSAIGGLPFVIAVDADYLDGFFEAMSGFTTTGITMFSGLEQMPRSIIFWRSLTQWIGGLGILTFFLSLIYRGAGTHRLFGAETHKIVAERPVPGLANTLKILWLIYAGLTAFITAALCFAGMPLFESVCHSFTALSTGGFSPYDASIAHYRIANFPNFIWIEYILILAMIMGGTNFLVHYRVFKRSFKSLGDNTEMRYWWTFIGVFVLLIFIERCINTQSLTAASFREPNFWSKMEESFRTVFFQVASIITTTGFGTMDIGAPFFGQMARQLFLVMMVIGGCVGSTGGGIKVLRVSILVKLVRRELFCLRTPPKSISTVIIDGKPIEANEIYRVGSLFFAWCVLLVIGGCITALLSNLGAYEAFSGMFSALGNIGPCYIPLDQMASLNPVIKIVYIFGMLAGRLEILPVLLIFSRKAWQSV